jgi:toxin ParE1/3/4
MRLRYTKPVLADLETVLDYVATHAPQGAKRVQARVQTSIAILLRHPGVGSKTDDPSVRRMTTTPYPYLIFYEPTVDESIIHAIHHSARDPAGMPGKT